MNHHIPRPRRSRWALLALALAVPGVGLAIDEGISSLVLPQSTAEQVPELAVHVVIDKHSVVVDGVQVLGLEQRTDDDGLTTMAIPEDELRGQMATRLYDRLVEKAETEKMLIDARRTLAVLAQKPELAERGEILLSIDKDTSFSTVRQVLYTAGQAQYHRFLFVTDNPWLDAQRVIESTLPRIGAPRYDDLDEEPPLMLSVAITDRGFDVMGADAVLHPEGELDSADPDAPMIPCSGDAPCAGADSYDWTELTRVLGVIKDEYPDDTQVILVPEREVTHEVIVRALDHARWAPELPLDAEQGAWEYWKSVRRELFPESILAGGAS